MNNKKITINTYINLCCLIFIFFNKEILNSQTRKLLKEKFKKPLAIFECILYIVYFTTIFMWTNNHFNISFYFSLIVVFLTLLVEDIVMGILSKKYL